MAGWAGKGSPPRRYGRLSAAVIGVAHDLILDAFEIAILVSKLQHDAGCYLKRIFGRILSANVTYS